MNAGTGWLPILAAVTLQWSGAATAAPPSITVQVRNALPSTGTVEVTLFNSEESYLKIALLQESGKPGESGEFTAEFAALEEGEYAIVVVHDENGNEQYDNGFLGLGAEALGYSNNACSWFGRPDFDDAKFTVDSEKTFIEIFLD